MLALVFAAGPADIVELAEVAVLVDVEELAESAERIGIAAAVEVWVVAVAGQRW